MKRTITLILSALLAVTMLLTLAGCGNKQETPAATTAAEPAASATEAAAQTSAGSITADDATFVSGGVSVELNAEADAIIVALGDYNNVSAQLSCHGGEGDDKTYTYNGFSVGTYPKDGVDRILEVVISESGIPTSKGVQVGDPVSKVTETYGDNFRKIGMYYAYDAGDGKSLQFFIENDAVQEIDYYYDV